MQKLAITLAALAFAAPAMAADNVTPPPVVVTTTTLAPSAAPAATRGISAATLQALMTAPGRSGSFTYEDVLAAVTRPIRLYDLNGDGLSADELDLVDQVRAAQMRAQTVQRFLFADLNNDRQVTREEFNAATRVGTSFRSQPKAFEDADTDGNGILSWDEMTSAPGGMSTNYDQMQRQRVMAITLDIDPTPDTNFTIADAKTAADNIMAAFDTNHDGVLDSSEVVLARAAGRYQRPLIN